MASPPQFQLKSLARGAWGGYCNALKRRPLLTKSLTGVVGTLLGDGIAQYAAHHARKPKKANADGSPLSAAQTALLGDPPTFQYDGWRCIKLCAYAALVGSPIAHYWFRFLDQTIIPRAPTSPKAVIVKLLLDQLVMAPIGMAAFFASLRVMDGGSLPQAVESVRSKLAPALTANYCLWPIANLINFAVVPQDQRILYINVIAVGWASVMSHLAMHEGEEEEAAGQLKAA